MRADAERFVPLVRDQGAAIYICGDGNRMAKDVQAAFIEMLVSNAQTANGSSAANGASLSLPKTKDEAQEYLETMKAESRFLMDIWS